MPLLRRQRLLSTSVQLRQQQPATSRWFLWQIRVLHDCTIRIASELATDYAGPPFTLGSQPSSHSRRFCVCQPF